MRLYSKPKTPTLASWRPLRSTTNSRKRTRPAICCFHATAPYAPPRCISCSRKSLPRRVIRVRTLFNLFLIFFSYHVHELIDPLLASLAPVSFFNVLVLNTNLSISACRHDDVECVFAHVQIVHLCGRPHGPAHNAL